MGALKDVITCWIIEPHEIESLTIRHIPFRPSYTPYMYFQLIKKDENTLEGYLGRCDCDDDFHKQITSRYSYFDDYLKNKKVYLTMDKTVIYELIEIIPSNPLLFILKKLKTDEAPIPPTSIKQIKVAATIHPIHFEDIGSVNFEKLVYAYVNRIRTWDSLSWLGETGNEQGRDIWGLAQKKTYCYQCANRKNLPAKKIKDDIDKLVNHGHIPDFFIVVSGCSVSAKTRSSINNYAVKVGIKNIEVWSGGELEEMLRKNASDILKRFFEGHLLPELDNFIPEGREEKKAFQFDTAPPLLEISLEPEPHLSGTEEEIALSLEDALFRIQNSIEPLLEIWVTQEKSLQNRYVFLNNSEKTIDNRRKALEIKKALITIEELKSEFRIKARLLLTANLYQVRNNFLLLVQSFKELLKVSININKLIEEIYLPDCINSRAIKKQPTRYQGKHKIDIFQRSGGKITFSIWLTDSELESLILKSPIKTDKQKILENMSFLGFECSDLSIEVFVNKVIPAFIDKIYDAVYLEKIIDEKDTESWIHLPSYSLGLG